MATYDTVDELKNAINGALETVMEGTVADFAKDALFISIGVNVYSAEEGKYKRRGENGGLQDMNNIVARYDPSDRELIVENVATGTYSHSGWRLDELVEKGTGYDFGGNAMWERPFYNYADEMLSDEPLKSGLDRAVEKELNDLV